MTIYIAGPVTGRPQAEYEAEFAAIEMKLRAQGNTVLNPVSMVQSIIFETFCKYKGVNPNRNNYDLVMKFCVHHLMLADELHLLHGWKFSRGSIIEHNIAERVGMKIRYPDYDRIEEGGVYV